MSKEAPANSAEIQITDVPCLNAGKDQENAHSVTIEIPDFEKEIWSACKIFRVPRNLRNLNIKAYTPQLVSIGPFHHDQEELKGMEYHKKKYFKKFCERAHMSEECLQSCVKKNYDKILASYAGSLHTDPQELGKLILIDACFIFELFIRFSLSNKYLQEDYILKTPWIMKAIRRDLILLENQLPFFFLEELYKHANSIVDIETSDGKTKIYPYPPKGCNVFDRLKAGIASCFNCASNSSSNLALLTDQQRQEATNNQSEQDEQSEDDDKFRKLTMTFFKDDFVTTANEIKEIEHFTDLVRKSWLPKDWEKKEKTMETMKKMEKAPVENLLYSATKLDKAGLNFVPAARKEGLACVEITTGLWYKYFPFCRSRRQLELSHITIDDSTECHMRNVMALEQCCYPLEAFICNYAVVLSNITETAEDIDLLVKKKVIKNLLGSSQKAADFANKLCHEIVQTTFMYSEECKKLNSFYESWLNVTRGTFKTVYFKDLWTASSTLVGIFVLIFTTYATYKSIVNS